jgi:hypothetical protein
MLTLTQPAKDMLQEMLDHAQAAEGRAIRMIPDPKGFIMQVDVPREDDEKHPQSGRPLLLLGHKAAQLLEGKTLDVKPTEKGLRLSLIDSPS